MRPRQKPSTERMLPTIREGYEELVYDMNQANSLHTPSQPQLQPQPQALSTQDYFRSICKLACPAFGQSEPDMDILTVGFLDSIGPCLRLPRTREKEPSSRQPLFQTASVSLQVENQESRGQKECRNPGRVAPSLEESSAKARLSASDPLEVLYGHGDTFYLAAQRSNQRKRRDAPQSGSKAQPMLRADSFPTIKPYSPQTECKRSCPELCLKDSASLEECPLKEEHIPTAVPALSWEPHAPPDSGSSSGSEKGVQFQTHTRAVPLDR